jgi:hypothetical protein
MEIDAKLKQCTCEKPQAAIGNGVFIGTVPADGWKIKPYIGKLVCFFCGGIVEREKCPDYDHVSGGTILARLKDLRVV